MSPPNSVTTPAGVTRAMWFVASCVAQTLPSAPPVIAFSPLPAVMPAENSVTAPAGVMRATRLPVRSVNQRLPSGPAVTSAMPAPGLMPAVNSVMVPAVRDPCDAVGLGEPEVAVRAGSDRSTRRGRR